MESKEKAKELVDNFIKNTKFYHEELGWIDDIDSAQQCSIIAVDEIIKECEKFFEAISENRKLFWQEVKQEIEKL